jgi:uncharacterized membrane protein YfcA
VSDVETEGGIDSDLTARIEFLELDARQFPKEKIAALILLWIVLLLLTFIIGGKGAKSLIGINCSQTVYYVLILLQFAWLFGFSTYYGLKILDERKRRDAVQYPWQPADIVWSESRLLSSARWCFAAGVVAGVIGIGGGSVLGPLMLTLGVDPRVSAATTATMIAMTASSLSVIYIIIGYIQWDYFLYSFFVCVSGAYIGKSHIDAYVKRTGMTSVLVGLLASIISLSVIGIAIALISDLSSKGWCLDGFSAFCAR